MSKGFTPLEKANFTGERSSLTGFTLLELMVVLLIVTVLGVALVATMSSGRTSWHEADTRISIQEELRRAIRQMIDDLSQSSVNKINISADNGNYSSLSFNVSTGVNNATGAIVWSSDPITYSLSGGQILRVQGSDTRVLANNISALNFVRYANSTKIVRLNLTAQKTTPYGRLLNASMSAAVYMRN